MERSGRRTIMAARSDASEDADIKGARFTVRLPVERSASDLPRRKS